MNYVDIQQSFISLNWAVQSHQCAFSDELCPSNRLKQNNCYRNARVSLFHCRCISCWSSLQHPDQFNWTALVFGTLLTRAIRFRYRILKYHLKWLERLESNLPFHLFFSSFLPLSPSVSPLLSYSISPCSLSCFICLNWNYLSSVGTAFESQAVQSGWNCKRILLSCLNDDDDYKIIIIVVIIITLLLQSNRVTVIEKSKGRKLQWRRKITQKIKARTDIRKTK